MIKLKEQFEIETDYKFPSGNQLAINDWFIEYNRWIEEKALLYFKLTHKKYEGNIWIENSDVDRLRRMMFGRD